MDFVKMENKPAESGERHNTIDTLKQEARSMHLVYVSSDMQGYTRRLVNKDFEYFNADNERITDEGELKRIKSLALPPAWNSVWICPKPNGHLQATGYDAAGRKQYKYHPRWSSVRNEQKHDRMMDFARALPAIRRQVTRDLKQKGFPREKVLALAITVLDKTFIRVGNSAYSKMYGSYGLTSLKNRHLKISGNRMIIAFKGKKGVFQEITLTHSRLSKLMRKLKDIPGQELFQFYDADGNKKSIDSGDVNDYLRACSQCELSAKDFRTWYGTVTALSELVKLPNDETQADLHKNVLTVMDAVAKKLGNTRAVCKKYYVNPELIGYYEDGRLGKYLDKVKTSPTTAGRHQLKAEEKLLVHLLSKQIQKGKSQKIN